MRGALEAMLDELAGEFGGPVEVFRKQRDLRFGRDRTPYKTRAYGVIGAWLDAHVSGTALEVPRQARS